MNQTKAKRPKTNETEWDTRAKTHSNYTAFAKYLQGNFLNASRILVYCGKMGPLWKS